MTTTVKELENVLKENEKVLERMEVYSQSVRAEMQSNLLKNVSEIRSSLDTAIQE